VRLKRVVYGNLNVTTHCAGFSSLYSVRSCKTIKVIRINYTERNLKSFAVSCGKIDFRRWLSSVVTSCAVVEIYRSLT
jgi:hypothetical protein